MKRLLAMLFLVTILLSLCACGGESSTSTGVQETDAITETEQETKSEDNIPLEYKSALKKAESYSSTMHMSKAVIYDQLISEYGEKFTEEEAQYAVDNLD
ncbi:MAG: Ltp family lipoprotein [Oscillospiraceae bacterium]|jgi:hypothetical protein